MTRQYIHLWRPLVSLSNLLLAFHKAARGKRSKAAASSFERHLEENLLQLHQELVDGSYHHGGYDSFHIHDPKVRLISAASFRDRVVHHALCNVIEPLFERQFIFDTYANRVGKGTHKALERCTQFMRRYRYVLPLDVRQFFPLIDHAVLHGIIGRVVHDERLLDLRDRILAGGKDILVNEYEMVLFSR